MSFPVLDWVITQPMITIFGWAAILLVIDAFFVPDGNKRVTGYLAMGGLAVTTILTIVLGARGNPTTDVAHAAFNGMIVLDSFALVMTLIFLVVGIISIAISLDYLPRQGIEQGESYPLIMFATGGMIVLAQSTDLVMLFLAVELLSITLYILTAFAYPRLSSEEAAMKYLLLGAFAAGFFVYGIALIYGQTQTFNLIEIGKYVGRSASQNTILLLVGSGFVLIAFSFKIALAPFHMWTPDVYEGAPTPVTAFMSVGTKGAALAAMLRLLVLALPTLQPIWMPILGTLAVLSMLVGNIGALTQTNVKRMLAYSSIGHAGYILLAVMTASQQGTESFVFYLISYAFTNLGAFAVLIALEQRGESAWSLDDFSGLWKRQSGLAVAMAIFMFSLAGVPPTAGFFAKFYVFSAAWQGRMGFLVLIALLTSAIAAFFYLRIIVRMFMEEPAQEDQPIPSLYSGLTISIGIAVVGTLVFGLLPTPIVSILQTVPMQVMQAMGG